MDENIQQQLEELTEIAIQIQLRSFKTLDKPNHVKYPTMLRDQLDEYFKKYPPKKKEPLDA